MRNKLLLFASALMILFAGCSKSPSAVDEPIDETGMVVISADITTNTTFTADKIYLLKNNVFVTGNSTLTIQPGTIIKGDKATKGSLIISRGSKIIADGTAAKPIVFTSSQAAGARAPGDWGGVVLLGKANSNNGTTSVVEGIPATIGDKALYGGTNDLDDSGILRYVRIEFAGIPLLPDVEINGLTLAGVGSTTILDYIEVYRSGDDAFEFFGGTVNAKHLLAIGTWDDDFDTDNGYSGKIQFALAQRAQVVADFSGSNGFESDNNSAGSTATPNTTAVFSNVTIVGPLLTATSAFSTINANFQHAVQIRRNSSISLFNSIIANYPEGIFIDDERPTAAGANNSTMNFAAGGISIKNNLIYGCNIKGNQIKFLPSTDATVLARQASISTSLLADNVFTPAASITALLANPLKYGADFKATTSADYGTPSFVLAATSAASTGAVFTGIPKLASGFESVPYRGAFGTTDWSAGWAKYDPQSMAYTTAGAVL